MHWRGANGISVCGCGSSNTTSKTAGTSCRDCRALADSSRGHVGLAAKQGAFLRCWAADYYRIVDEVFR